MHNLVENENQNLLSFTLKNIWNFIITKITNIYEPVYQKNYQSKSKPFINIGDVALSNT